MRATRLELMKEHVHAIHRGLTGSDPPEPSAALEAEAPTFEEVQRRFVELDAIARTNQRIAERVPPYSFEPPLDLFGTERELLVELGVPGLELADVDVEIDDGELIVSGARVASATSDGRICFHAEMARGPFHRAIRLPDSISGTPKVEIENGIVRIRLARANKSPLPRA